MVLSTQIWRTSLPFTNFFGNLFMSSSPLEMSNVLECIMLRVNEDMNNFLCTPYTRERVDKALKQMHPHKASGPDGMNPFFYQKFWDSFGHDVSAAVLSILIGHFIPLQLNHTHVAFLPKKPQPELIFEYRHISLCNVVYKVVKKLYQTA